METKHANEVKLPFQRRVSDPNGVFLTSLNFVLSFDFIGASQNLCEAGDTQSCHRTPSEDSYLSTLPNAKKSSLWGGGQRERQVRTEWISKGSAARLHIYLSKQSLGGGLGVYSGGVGHSYLSSYSIKQPLKWIGSFQTLCALSKAALGADALTDRGCVFFLGITSLLSSFSHSSMTASLSAW